MSVLDSDSPLMQVGVLSGVHEDAVRCVYDERLNRLRRLADSPAIQLERFVKVTDDALEFWRATSEFPEDRDGRRQKLSDKLGVFFDRVVRYAQYYPDDALTESEIALKIKVIIKAQDNKAALVA